MANRDKRSIPQPTNYKDFNERGLNKEEGAENVEGQANMQTMNANGDPLILEVSHPSPLNQPTDSQETVDYGDNVNLHVEDKDDDFGLDTEVRTLKKKSNIEVHNSKQNGRAKPKTTVKQLKLLTPIQSKTKKQPNDLNFTNQVTAVMSKKDKAMAKKLGRTSTRRNR